MTFFYRVPAEYGDFILANEPADYRKVARSTSASELLHYAFCGMQRVSIDECGEPLTQLDFPHWNLQTLAMSNGVHDVLAPRIRVGSGVWRWIDLDGVPFCFLFPEVVDVVDWERSDVRRFRSGRVMAVRDLVLTPNLPEHLDILCLPRATNKMLVSQQFLDLVDEHRFSGIAVRPIDGP